MPDSAKTPQNELEVIALGTDGEFPVEVGNVVLIDKYTGQEITIGDVIYIIAKVSEITGICKYSLNEIS